MKWTTITVSVAWLCLNAQQLTAANASSGRYEASQPTLCTDGGPASFSQFAAFTQQDIDVAGKKSPYIWLSEIQDKPVLGLLAQSTVKHWTCPPDGDSVLIHHRFSYIALFDLEAPGDKGLNRIGFFEINRWNFDQMWIPNKLIPNVAILDPYWEDRRVDGAIEGLRYIGPKNRVELSISPVTSEGAFVASFKGVCADPQATLKVEYRKSTCAHGSCDNEFDD